MLGERVATESGDTTAATAVIKSPTHRIKPMIAMRGDTQD
jgi:hypothetical protein